MRRALLFLLVPVCAIAAGVWGMRRYEAGAERPAAGRPALAAPSQPAPAEPVPAPAAEPAPAAPVGPTDLGVRFISRSPLYWRYNVIYQDGVPKLAPTHDG